MIQLQEHEFWTDKYDDKYEHLSLLTWDRPFEGCRWGYYASYKIGAEWVDETETLVVTTKQGMEKIDFLCLFMSCFTSDLALESFSEIYTIDFENPRIYAPSLKNVISPLIVFHFLGVISRIKTLKRGYVHHIENLKKVKGHIQILKNERKNIVLKRYNRIYCSYDEYSVDIPENRLLKKALLFCQRFLQKVFEETDSYFQIKSILTKSLLTFEDVSADVHPKDVLLIRGHKLFKEYAEAIRLAKIILSHFDYSINKAGNAENKVVPFVLDMSLLYEHYVYGLLYEAYQKQITYQFKGKTGYPDFLYKSKSFKAILDTKYIPKYDKHSLDTYVVRQLSGYSRDLSILKYLGYDGITEDSPVPDVPCVIIYPQESDDSINPFLGRKLEELCGVRVEGLSRFYKITIPLPTLNQ